MHGLASAHEAFDGSIGVALVPLGELEEVVRVVVFWGADGDASRLCFGDGRSSRVRARSSASAPKPGGRENSRRPAPPCYEPTSGDEQTVPLCVCSQWELPSGNKLGK